MKATEPGYVIGKALEGWKPTCDGVTNFNSLPEDNAMNCVTPENFKDKVPVFVSLGYYAGAEQGLSSKEEVSELSPKEATESAEIRQALEELANRIGLLETFLAVENDLDLFDLEAEDATISGTLQVLGKTILSELGITGKITSGLLSIDGLTNADNTDQEADSAETGASISTLSGPLKLQELALGNLEIFGGKIVFDTKGNIKVEGNIEVKGKIKAKEIELEKGATFKDQITGEYYCVTIVNGELAKQEGKCQGEN